MKNLLLSSVLVLSLGGCLSPSGVNPPLGCSPYNGCTSRDYYLPGRLNPTPKPQFSMNSMNGMGGMNGMSGIKATVGALGGAALGAALGAKKSPLAAAGFSVAGLVIGREIGSHFDKVDQIYATSLLKQTLSNNRDGQLSTWQNPNKGFSVTQGPVASNGNCREFVSNVQVGREYRKVRGTACMENGVWIMKELY